MPNSPDVKITAYLDQHRVFTLATVNQLQPYCAICFYAYSAEKNKFYFMSKTSTRHSREALINKRVAGSITTGEVKLNKMKGLQFTGQIEKLSGSSRDAAKQHYFKKFPFARLSRAPLWAIEPDFFKLTNNGTGKKIIWEKETLITE